MLPSAIENGGLSGLFRILDLPILAAGVPLDAEGLFGSEGALGWFTNSVFVAAVVTILILVASRKATRKLSPIPSGYQNFFEYVIEFLYGQVEGIVGKKVAPRAFPLLATIFLFVLLSNWFGLLPGVGTIGFGQLKGPLTLDTSQHITPLLRPATSDLNMTFGIAIVFMVVWAWLTFRELGVIGFIKHVFGPKGGLTGFLGIALIPIFLFVGVIEVVSIGFRPVSLAMRLFGNVYAGETLLHTMSSMIDGVHPIVDFLAAVLLPLPFFFLEILVGILQATVFSLLCAVYIQLSTSHDEEEH